jgi:hypothetical protein
MEVKGTHHTLIYTDDILLGGNISGPPQRTRLEMGTSLNILKFQRSSSYHIMGNDVSRSIKEVTNTTVLSKVAMMSMFTAVIM